MVSHRLRAYYDELIKWNNAPTSTSTCSVHVQQHNIMRRLINKERDSVTATAPYIVYCAVYTHTHTHTQTDKLLLYDCLIRRVENEREETASGVGGTGR